MPVYKAYYISGKLNEAYSDFTMVALLLLTVLYGAIFYIVTTITLKKRLNLE